MSDTGGAPAMMSVSEAVASRRSVRAFLDKPVDVALVRDLIGRAVRAPSGGNLQPWHLHLLAGEKMADFKAIMRARTSEAPFGVGSEYPVYPAKLDEPYRSRRFAVGEAMYAAMGVAREEKARRLEWFASNYQFFGAPVGLFCYVPRDHGPPQWSDCGMMLQTLMLLLREAGLDSCAQEAWATHHDTVDAFLKPSPGLMLFTGMAIGWRDPDAAVNGFEVERAPLHEVLTVHG